MTGNLFVFWGFFCFVFLYKAHCSLFCAGASKVQKWNNKSAQNWLKYPQNWHYQTWSWVPFHDLLGHAGYDTHYKRTMPVIKHASIFNKENKNTLRHERAVQQNCKFVTSSNVMSCVTYGG